MIAPSSTAVNKPQYILIGTPVQTSPYVMADIFEPVEPLLQIAIPNPTNTLPIGLSDLRVSLADLEPGYYLRRPISINVQRIDRNNYVAKFAEVNMNASGESFHEAIINLKALIVDMFDLLRSVESQRLGPEPSNQLRTLTTIIRKSK